MIGRSPLNQLRTIARYTALAAGVTVGGVMIGAIVVAPAVSRTTSHVSPAITLMPDNAAPIPRLAEPLAPQNATGPFTPMAALTSTLAAVARVPKIVWVYGDAAVVLALVAVWGWRRRSARALAPAAAGRPSGLVPPRVGSDQSKRTPRAVMALAASGAAPADIARRTGLSIDAVAMCLAIGA